MFSRSFLSLALAGVFWCPAALNGQTMYEHCNKALEKDLYNIVTSSSSEASAASDLVWHWFLSTSEQEAYKLYSDYYDSQVGQKSGGEVNAVIKLVPIGAKGEHGYNRKLEQAEFGESYRRMKASNQGAGSRQSSSASSRAGQAASYVRDQGVIKAWEACVLKDPAPGLYAYGFRDQSGHAYVKIVWTPGSFAGAAPRVEVDFVNHDDISVDAPKPAVIAVGSGKTFSVTSDDEDSFEVHVNGQITAGQVSVANFTHGVTIPARRLARLAFGDVGRGTYAKFIAKHSLQCMDVDPRSDPSAPTPIVQRACDQSESQLWRVDAASAGYYTIRVKKHDKCLGIFDWYDLTATAPNLPSIEQLRQSLSALSDEERRGMPLLVIEADCNGTDGQLWQVENVRDDFVKIVAKNSGKCLAVTFASTHAGATLSAGQAMQVGCNGQDNELWRRISGRH